MKILIFIFLLVAVSPSFAANLTPAQCEKVLRIRHRVETIDNLENRQILSKAQARTERLAYLKKASQYLGRPITYGQLKEMTKGLKVIPKGPRKLKEVPQTITANKNIGFFVVLLLLATVLWFTVKTLPLAPVVGFSESGLFIRFLSVVLSLLIVLLVLTLLRLRGIDVTGCGKLEQEAINFLAYLYLGGVTVLSSKWYRQEGRMRSNVFACLSFVLAIALSHYLQFSHLLRVAITFLGLYGLSKYFEIPWKKQAYVIALLGLCAIAFLIYQLRIAYPAYFLF